MRWHTLLAFLIVALAAPVHAVSPTSAETAATQTPGAHEVVGPETGDGEWDWDWDEIPGLAEKEDQTPDTGPAEPPGVDAASVEDPVTPSAGEAAGPAGEAEASGDDWDWDEIPGLAEEEDQTPDTGPAEPSSSDSATVEEREIPSEVDAAAPKDEAETSPGDWGWDWDEVMDSADAGDQTPPAVQAKLPGTESASVETTETPGETETVAPEGEPAGEGWDWDWEETPAATGAVTRTRKPVREKEDETGEAVAKTITGPRVGSTAEPDFDGKIRTGYRLFAEVPPFEVIPSKKDSDMHPCLDCHDWAESDLTPRELQEPHDNFKLEHGLHGKGEFWCFTCHHLEGDGGLRTLEGVKLPFDEAYIVCSQCHAQETRDWYSGAHGKRVANWRGNRQILNCTACHYQHKPSFARRLPMPGPRVRMGMERPKHWVPKRQREHGPKTVERSWDRYARKPEEQAYE